VAVGLEETVSVVCSRDGGLESLEVKGELTLRVSDPSKALLRLGMRLNPDPAIQFKNHPNVDKALFSAQSVLGLKDPAKPFPLHQAVGVLKWRYVSKDESKIPLSISCWPTPPNASGECAVTVEYELLSPRLTLRNVVITIPYGQGVPAPIVKEVEGDYHADQGRHLLHWSLPLLDASNGSGIMEFTVRAADTNTFFPIQASWACEQSFCDLAVLSVTHSQTGEAVDYAAHTSTVSETYSIV
jgi:hypothetical protein